MRRLLLVLALLALLWRAVRPALEDWLEPLPSNLAPYQQLRDHWLECTPPKTAPGPSDWLAQNSEPGQTLEDYARAHLRPAGPILLLPLSPFERHPTLLAEVQKALRIQLGSAVRLLPATTLELPPEAHRGGQLLTGAIQSRILSQRPADALALVALTESDLWPGPGWNYVFGQANLVTRVGVWSTCRLEADDEELFLRRTIRTAVHETGHLLGLAHCAAHECLMNGANSLPEADSQTLVMCGECAPKLIWRFGLDARQQLAELIELGQAQHWEADVRQWRQQLQTVGGGPGAGIQKTAGDARTHHSR